MLIGGGVRVVFGKNGEVDTQGLEPEQDVLIQLCISEGRTFLRRTFLRRAGRRGLCGREIHRVLVPRDLPVRPGDRSWVPSVGQSSPRFMESTAWVAARAVRAI